MLRTQFSLSPTNLRTIDGGCNEDDVMVAVSRVQAYPTACVPPQRPENTARRKGRTLGVYGLD